MTALEGLTRKLAEAPRERQATAIADLLEHLAAEVRAGNASVTSVRSALAPGAAWARSELRWADGWFSVFETGPRGTHA
jgi:hypothetical protein